MTVLKFPAPLLRALACLALLGPARASAAQTPLETVSFRIMDEVFPPETEETITVTINHVPVGMMTLGPQKVRDSVSATVPAAREYRYDLCGHAKIVGVDGKVTILKIDNGGTLNHLDGRVLGIFNGASYSVSYLRDMAVDGQSEAAGTITAGHSCPDTVAMVLFRHPEPDSGPMDQPAPSQS